MIAITQPKYRWRRVIGSGCQVEGRWPAYEEADSDPAIVSAMLDDAMRGVPLHTREVRGRTTVRLNWLYHNRNGRLSAPEKDGVPYNIGAAGYERGTGYSGVWKRTRPPRFDARKKGDRVVDDARTGKLIVLRDEKAKLAA